MNVRLKKIAGKLGVGSSSLLIVAALTLMIVNPSELSFVTAASTSSIAGSRDVFYGKVTLDGHPVNHARVVLYHFAGGYQPRNLRVDAIYYTAEDGTYRHAQDIPAGRHYEQVSFRVQGHLRRSKPRRFDVNPGHAYRADANARHRGVFTFFPSLAY
jgi:hypothetical protein